MTEKGCCITGHKDLPESTRDAVKQKLRQEIESCIADGYLNFITGFLPGPEQWAAEVICELMPEHPGLTLEAVIPYKNYLVRLCRDRHTLELLQQCSVIRTLSRKFYRECIMNKNRFMVNNSDCMIAVYDGRDNDDTVFAMRHATVLERELHIIEIK